MNETAQECKEILQQRQRRLHEQCLLVQAYMRIEDTIQAQAHFAAWVAAVKLEQERV